MYDYSKVTKNDKLKICKTRITWLSENVEFNRDFEVTVSKHGNTGESLWEKHWKSSLTMNNISFMSQKSK